MENLNFTHKKGEFVVYKCNGICEIKDIRAESFGGMGEKTFYVLETVSDGTKIYVPADSEKLVSQMYHILTRDEINGIIGETERSDNKWIDDAKERSARFQEMLQSGSRTDILWIFKIMSAHKAEVEGQKKRFYASDGAILETAERIIGGEFSYVLGIGRDEVLPYITEQSKKNNA